MPATDNRQLRAALAPRMLLAALILLLPLLVIAAITVSDKNAHIATIDGEIHGIEYLVESRKLLEGTTDYFLLVGNSATAETLAELSHRIDNCFDTVDRHLSEEGDEFEIRSRLDAARMLWARYTAETPALPSQQRMELQQKIETKLLELFRHIGNRSGLAAAPTIETAYISRLVIRQIPEAVVRIGEIRIHDTQAASDRRQPNATTERQHLYNDWSLTLAHTELVRDFATASALNPRLDGMLGIAVDTFNRRAHAFHQAVSESSESGASDFYNTRNLPGGSKSAVGQMNTIEFDRITLGKVAADAAFDLFDNAVDELASLLTRQRAALVRTKTIAVGAVIGASLFAVIAGLLLLNAMTRPLQEEIAERRRAEQQARALAAIVESSQDSILVIGPEGTFKSWNRGAERLYGFRADEAVGQPTSLLAPPGLQAETPVAIAAALRGVSTPTIDTVRKRKDGTFVNVSLRTSPVYDDNGDVTGIAVIGRDITDRKRAEAELREKERALQAHVAELSQAQRELRAHRDHLEELVKERTAEVEAQAAKLEEALHREKEFNALQRKFVTMASHEFRTPLAIIDAAAQRIGRRAQNADPEDTHARVSRIRSAVARMLELIESTLSLSRIEEGKVVLRARQIDIRNLVVDVCNRQQEIAPKHHIRTALDELPDEIVGDPQLLDHVFSNLLSNAVKYAPDAPDIDVTGYTTDGAVAISVLDRGRGIPETEQSQIFQRYFRASTSNGIAGTGLGLNLAHEFVTLHGGSIDIESKVNVGTTITVTLPLDATLGAESEMRSTSTTPSADDRGIAA